MSKASPSQTVYSIGYDFHVGNGTAGADNGNVWGITNYKDTTRNQSFTYDPLNRLTSAQNAGTNCAATTVNSKTEYWGNNYTYDAWGNLTAKTVTKCGAENLSAPALVNNQLSGYGYDAAGNMISDPTDGGLALSYDQENRIQGAGGYTYTYDADGNRVKKTNGATGTIYWYMTPGIVAESDLAGNLKSEYVFFDGERVARRDLPAGTVAYYFSDHLKTASVITDSLGNIKSESDYYPWGGELQFVNNDSNHFKFTGKERDETGLDYFGARYYSNGLARFITPDWSSTPIPVPYADFGDPQSLDQYSYVRNIPTTRADEDGHDGVVVLILSTAEEITVGGPLSLLAFPSVIGMEIAASHPMENHPATNTLNASDMMLDALNPPYVVAPPLTPSTIPTGTPGTDSTSLDAHAPASTSQEGTIGTSTAQTKTGVPLAERDPKRRFTPQEAQELKDKAQGKCATCGKATVKPKPYTKGSKHSPREGQAGHKKAWSRGGRTTPKNGKWQCKGCNQAEGANSK